MNILSRLRSFTDTAARAKVANIHSAEEALSQLAAVLYLPITRKSIGYRAYLDTVNSEPLIEWFFNIFASNNPKMRLSVLFHTEDETIYLQELCMNHGAIPISTPHYNQIQAFQQAAKKLGKLYTAFFSIEMGLSPRDLLTNTFFHHVQQRNIYTYVQGLPAGCSPEVYNSDFLMMIHNLTISSLPQHPREIIRDLADHSKDRRWATSLLRRLLHSKLSWGQLSVLVRLFSDSFRSMPFDASNYYGRENDLPESVAIRNNIHLETMRDVNTELSLADLPQTPLRTLCLWKKVSLQKRRAIRERLLTTLRHPVSEPNSKKCRRILYVSNPSAYTGAQESLCQLIGHIDPARYESFALVGVSGVFTERLNECGATVITQERDFSVATVDNFLFTLSILKKVQPDIIHINGSSGVPIIVAAKLLEIPVVYHVRAHIEGTDETLNNSDIILTVSEFIKKEVGKRDVEKERIRVVYDGVDTERFSRKNFVKSEIRKELRLSQNARIILNIARFAPYKRHDLLIAACQAVRKSIPNCHLVLVGEVEDRQYYQSIVDLIAKSGLSDYVTFFGFQRDIRRIEAAADLLVLCSDREPLGTCLIEAMSMELPVVVTNSGGSHELFRHGITGIVTPGNNAFTLATGIINVMTDSELAGRLSQAAREFAETDLNINLHAKRVVELYDEIIEQRSHLKTASLHKY